MENRIIKNGNENELIALELLHEHGNAVVEAPVLVITPKKPPRIITKKQTSSAPPGKVSGFAAPSTISVGAPVKP